MSLQAAITCFPVENAPAFESALPSCQYCGQAYNPALAEICGITYHPLKPEVIGARGPETDYRDICQFPCCGLQQDGTVVGGHDEPPPQSPGCARRKHSSRAS